MAINAGFGKRLQLGRGPREQAEIRMEAKQKAWWRQNKPIFSETKRDEELSNLLYLSRIPSRMR